MNPMLNVKNKITKFAGSGRMEVMARLLAAETFSHTVAGRYMETLPFRISYSYCLTLFAGFRLLYIVYHYYNIKIIYIVLHNK